jgi:hypothetical protein
MEIHIIRDTFKDGVTLGKLYVDNQYLCETLEDTDRRLEDANNKKIPGKTAIPCGTYNMIVNQSARFKTLMPLVENVPQFEGIRIHAGNTAEDTEGCILLGLSRQGDKILESRAAVQAFMHKVYPFVRRNKVSIKIFRKEVPKDAVKGKQ